MARFAGRVQPPLEREASIVGGVDRQTQGDSALAPAGHAWQYRLPTLHGHGVTLREFQSSDASALLLMLSTRDVSRHISPPPETLDGMERFISWSHVRRRQGRYLCFAVVPVGFETPVGIFQLQAGQQGFATAGWGFALAASHWGTGLFGECAHLVLRFAFETLGANRIETRATVENRRGNRALVKLGAVCAGTLPGAFEKDGRLHDQYLWVIDKRQWRADAAHWLH